jgi:hypothetical protein
MMMMFSPYISFHGRGQPTPLLIFRLTESGFVVVS